MLSYIVYFVYKNLLIIFRPLQFYLVLDVTNMTNHEMELHYTQNKCIYMEGKEPCRIPVPVDRCPLNKLSMVSII